MFMMAFAQDDIPAGHWPSVKIGGVAQDVSLGTANQCSYWLNGAVMLCPAFFRSGSSLGASASVTIDIVDGGTSRPTSTLTAADVRSQLVQVNVKGLPNASQSNLHNEYTAQFFNTHATQLEELRLFEGPAGIVQRNMADFYPANTSYVPTSATAHGRVVAYGYTALLQNPNGTIAGCRFLPRITQPYYADTVGGSNPAKTQAAFSVCQWQASGLSAVSFPFPFTAKTVTPTSSSNGVNDIYTASGAHGYFTGAGASNWSTLGCTLTGANLPIAASDDTGSHPLNATDLYYLGASQGFFPTPTTQMALSTTSNKNAWAGGVTNILHATGTATFTVNPCFVCNTFGSIFGASTSATWNYFQGTGNTASDSPIISTMGTTALAYLKSTGLIPPFDLAPANVTAANGYSIDTDTADFSPFSIAPFEMAQENGGDTDRLGPWSGYPVRYLGTQSPGGERLTRKAGYTGAHQAGSFRDATLRTLVNLAEVNGAQTYTGMPPSVAQSVVWLSNLGASAGFTAPAASDNLWTFDQNLGSHKPCFAYPAYLIWGEPQWQDIQLETANQAILSIANGDRNPPFPTQLYACVTRWNGGELRGSAWPYRDVAQAAIVAPGKRDASVLDPGGTAISKYYYDIVNTSSADFVNMINALSAIDGTGYTAATGNWMVSQWQTSASTPDGVASDGESEGWQRAYMVTSACLAACACENTDALAFLVKEQLRLNHIASLFPDGSGGTLAGFQLANFEERAGITIPAGVARFPIPSDLYIGQTFTVSGNTWTNVGPRFFSGTFLTQIVPANDDLFNFDSNANSGIPTTSPAGKFVVDNGVYGLRDVTLISGTTYEFNLYDAINDPIVKTVIAPTNTSVSNGFGYAAHWQIKHPPLASNPQPWQGFDPTLGTEVLAQVRWMMAAMAFNSVSHSLTAVEADLAARVASKGMFWQQAVPNDGGNGNGTPARWRYTTTF